MAPSVGSPETVIRLSWWKLLIITAVCLFFWVGAGLDLLPKNPQQPAGNLEIPPWFVITTSLFFIGIVAVFWLCVKVRVGPKGLCKSEFVVHRMIPWKHVESVEVYTGSLGLKFAGCCLLANSPLRNKAMRARRERHGFDLALSGLSSWRVADIVAHCQTLLEAHQNQSEKRNVPSKPPRKKNINIPE